MKKKGLHLHVLGEDGDKFRLNTISMCSIIFNKTTVTRTKKLNEMVDIDNRNSNEEIEAFDLSFKMELLH